ncbi:transcriptional regulator [Salmonella enterica]|nr:transcriptional regulator [Salmonella enterica]
MTNFIASQKVAKNGTMNDWHRAYVIAALHARGVTLAQLSRDNGLAARTLNNAFARSYPKAEKIIATAIGCHPYEIWPSRYQSGESV